MQRRNVHYQFTAHAKDRFREHFGKLLSKNIPLAKTFADELYLESKPDKSMLCDSVFMLHLGEKYGYEATFQFRVSPNAVFVIREDTVVTVYPKKGSRFESRRGSRF